MFAAADEDGVDEPDAIVFTPAVDPRHYDDTEFTEETHGAKTQTGVRLQGCKTHPVREKKHRYILQLFWQIIT